MRFEHLVEINDPLNPLLQALTAAQLWRGLALRAEQPLQFVQGLDGFAIRAREAEAGSVTLVRSLDFGSFRVRDRVVLTPPHRSHTVTEGGPTWPESRLTITIEELGADALYLRFLYEFDGEDAAGDEAGQILALRRQAYTAADLDTVARIRALAEAGTL